MDNVVVVNRVVVEVDVEGVTVLLGVLVLLTVGRKVIVTALVVRGTLEGLDGPMAV